MLQNINMHKSVKFGVCKAAGVEISDWEKKLTAFKEMRRN